MQFMQDLIEQRCFAATEKAAEDEYRDANFRCTVCYAQGQTRFLLGDTAGEFVFKPGDVEVATDDDNFALARLIGAPEAIGRALEQHVDALENNAF